MAASRPSTMLRMVPLPRKSGGGSTGAARSALFLDQRDNGLDAGENFRGRNPKRCNTMFREPSVTSRIASRIRPHLMTLAVDFDAQGGRGAVEVQDITSQCMLAPEFVTARMSSERAPEQNLWKRHRPAERPRAVNNGLPACSHIPLQVRPSTRLRLCWSKIVSPGHDLGLPGAIQSSNTLPCKCRGGTKTRSPMGEDSSGSHRHCRRS